MNPKRSRDRGVATGILASGSIAPKNGVDSCSHCVQSMYYYGVLLERQMKTLRWPAVLVLLVLVAGMNIGWAQSADSADRTAPSYDMKAQSLLDLERVQKKFSDLLDVVPADKLTWRPSGDSRSFAELFLHVAGERY